MELAVRAALNDLDLPGVDAARAAMALSLSRLVDAGSVPAARELRGVLEDLSAQADDEFRNWVATVQIPGRLEEGRDV